MTYPIIGTDDDCRSDLRYFDSILELPELMSEIQWGNNLTSVGTRLSDTIESINLAIF